MNNNFLNFLDGGYKGISQIRNSFPNEVNNIIEFNKNFKITNWGQMLFNYINNISEPPKCKCGNVVKFIKFNRGYPISCSLKCKGSNEDTKNRIKQSFLKKYGVENPLQSPKIQEKRKKIFFEKHGVEHQSQLAEVKEKKKQTNMKNFGCEFASQNEEVKKKIINTKIDRGLIQRDYSRFKRYKKRVKELSYKNKKKLLEEKEKIFLGKETNKFIPTELGMKVTDLLVKYFPEVLDYKFTSDMADHL